MTHRLITLLRQSRIASLAKCYTRSSPGMAVVMALAVVLLMVTAAMELHLDERANLMKAAAERDRVTMREMATSGVHLAMAMLSQDRKDTESDSLQEDWADEESIAALTEQFPFDEGQIGVKIIDELGKIQINAMVIFPEGQQFNEVQHQLWERFSNHLLDLYQVLGELGEELEGAEAELEDIEPVTIINSIKDWLDSGDDEAITGLSGAESDYYEELDPPYACKNNPFDHLSEVSLVKGVTPSFFNGFGGAAGLSSYITVYGAAEAKDNQFAFPGQININTAELPVLAALVPSENADFAELLVEYREAVNGAEYTNDLSSKTWYKNVPGFAGINIDPSQITVSSDIFRILATAQINEMVTTITAVVQREKSSESDHWQCKVLNWKQD